MSNRDFIFILVVSAYLLLGAALFAKTPVTVHTTAYEAGANAALNVTLQVALEWREMKINFTWQQLQMEVARRLKVRRNQPWK